MKYYIGDLHLYTRNQTEEGRNYDNRPFKTQDEMAEYILKKWNSKITNGDIVYILGDISTKGKNEKIIELVARLKGHKILIKGNHDDVSDYRYARLFDEICDYKEITDSYDGKNYHLVLSHYPILFWKGQKKKYIHLYAHLHDSYEDNYFQKCIHEINSSDDFRHKGNSDIVAINTGCMKNYINYEPRTLRDLLQIKILK